MDFTLIHPSASKRASRKRGAGFTLLEMVMVMFVLSLLLGAIFSIVRGTVQLTDELATMQTKEARQHGLSRLCERVFRHLPAQAMVRLRNKQIGNRYLYQLALVNAPSPMGMGGGVVTVLETEEATDGYLRLYLRSMNAEQAVAWEKGQGDAGTRLLLLEQIANLEWRFYNSRSAQWEPLWNEMSELPLQGLLATGIGMQMNPDGTPNAGPGTAPPPTPTPTPGMGDGNTPMTPGMGGAGAMARGQRPHLVELRFSIGAEAAQRWLFWSPPVSDTSGG